MKNQNAFPESNNSQLPGMTMRQFYKSAFISSVTKSFDGKTFNAPNIVQVCANLADAMIAEDEEFEKNNPKMEWG